MEGVFLALCSAEGGTHLVRRTDRSERQAEALFIELFSVALLALCRLLRSPLVSGH